MFPKPHFVQTNGIRMGVYEQGDGPAVVLLHGFPELAYSWRHQLPALADAGYRAIAPDQRGYGATPGPNAVDAYSIEELIEDIHGLLDALELDSAVFVGHDWGAILLWNMAMRAPARIEKLVMLNIPHYPRTNIDPIENFRNLLGDDFYIVNFQHSDEAEKAFAADPVHFFNMMMRRNQITREQFRALPLEMKSLSLLKVMARKTPGGDPLLSNDERDVFANAFANSGFRNPINWYRNWTKNWEALDGVDQIIDIPTLFIGAADDVVVSLRDIEAMKPYVRNLTVRMIEHCGHWSQQEHPLTVNRLIIDWLSQEK